MKEYNYREIINKQRTFFSTGSTLSLDYRIEALNKLKAAIKKQEKEGMLALSNDLGRSDFESYMGEWGEVLIEIDQHIKNLKKWAKPKREKTPIFLRPSYSRTLYEPYGVTLILSPWNYPFSLAILPLIAAISAGNTAVIKPSEIAPHTEKFIQKLISSTFDEKYVAVVEGGIPETTELLKEKFDFIFFTGSTKVGRIISEAAAKNLTPVVLELGGKSPVIVDDTANLKISVKRILMGKLTNCGQVCVAPDYLFLKKGLKEAFVNCFEEVLLEFFEGKSLEEPASCSEMTRIINDKNFNRLKDLLSDEKILWGGRAFEDKRQFQPTLIDSGDVRDYLERDSRKTRMLREEIFGPFLPVITYESLEDVIRYIKSNPKPLALYIFSSNKETINRVLARVSFGGGCINDTMIHVANNHLPFGGVGDSGYGKYHGKTSFLTFSHEKGIVYSSTLIDIPLKYLPGSAKKLKILKRIYK